MIKKIMKKIFIIILILTTSLAFSQSRKKIKKAGYTSKIEYKYEYRNGKEKKTKASETNFDINGNIITYKEYDEFGKLKKHIKYSYNTNNNKIKEEYYLPNGKLKKIIKYKYINGFKTEKAIYYGNGKIKSKKEYVFNK
ncbi:MAG: hypothetical protein DRI94_14140 [Bacteroidetes bacterium]|nr:MAG: hypothetical protein DRI94_14140 [Bacteroidota bacterium]